MCAHCLTRLALRLLELLLEGRAQLHAQLRRARRLLAQLLEKHRALRLELRHALVRLSLDGGARELQLALLLELGALAQRILGLRAQPLRADRDQLCLGALTPLLLHDQLRTEPLALLQEGIAVGTELLRLRLRHKFSRRR